MTVSPITICSNALVLLGGEPISSFTDGDTGSRIAALLYPITYKSMLTETRWRFAVRTALLAKHTVKPTNGWTDRFQLPQDCLYVVTADTRFYEIYERDLYANAPSIRIEYVYPVDEANLPAFFVKALEYNLASQFAIPLTGNTTRAQFYQTLYAQWVKKARFADASQRPSDKILSAPYIRVRR